MSSPVARVEDLAVYFQTRAGVVHAVDGISFEIGHGETLGLVGETGCGKSVTARAFLRLVVAPPGIYARGRILFWSRETRETGADPVDLLTLPMNRLREIRGNRIAMIFQDPGKALNPALSIREQIAEVFYQHRSAELIADLGGRVSGLVRRQAHQESTVAERVLMKVPPFRGASQKLKARVDDLVAEALAETQISSPRKVMASYPHQLSGGMKQRVMIAQALACNPDLLIADEPTTALDVTIQARILELIRELQQRRRTSVLYISHDLSLVRRICDRVAVMYAGRIAEVGPTASIFSDRLHPYTRGLLAAVPSRGQRRGALAAIEGSVPELVEPPPACRFHTRCRYAVDLCSRVDPTLAEPAHRSHLADGRYLGDPGHQVACLAYESDSDWSHVGELPRVPDER